METFAKSGSCESPPTAPAPISPEISFSGSSTSQALISGETVATLALLPAASAPFWQIWSASAKSWLLLLDWWVGVECESGAGPDTEIFDCLCD